MINFDADTHTYTNEEGRKLISVTTLMRKHGLSPDYGAVNPVVLKAAAERGTLIHKEIEDYIKKGEIGFTSECDAFMRWVEYANMTDIESEVRMHNDIVAGTCDLLFTMNGAPYIADIKTTSVLHKDALSWQLSIYNLLNGWKCEYGQAFHFDKEGKLHVVNIPLKPKDEVEKLMQCEREGVIYKQDLPVEATQLAIIEEAQMIIEQADRDKKAAEARMEEVKKAIMEAMEKNAIKSFENAALKITYIEASTRSTLDSAKLKKDMPEIIEKYTKTSPTKASLRITLKGE